MALVLRRGRRVDEASPEQPPIPAAPRPRRVGRVARFLLACILPALVGGGAAFALDAATSDHFFPGTRIGGVQVGGRSVSDAEALLDRALVGPLHRPIVIEADGEEIVLTPWNLGMRIDVERVLRETRARQHSVPILERTWKRIAGDRSDVPLDRYIEDGALDRALAGIVGRVDRGVRDASLDLTDDGTLRLVEEQTGREVDVEGASTRIVAALRADSERVVLPVHITEPEQRAADFGRVIVIRTRSNTLDLYEQGVVMRHYGVATGTGGYPTPIGQFRITAMRRNPSWGNPGSPWAANLPAYIPPGPNNPLGTRAMNINVSGIRIHGTPEADSIGTNASHGCVRMHMTDAEELFELVGVGTPVLIVRA